MKPSGRTITFCVISSFILASGTPVFAVNAGANPYVSIVDRNVFGLKPPPPAVPPEPPPDPPGKITLTGITTILGVPQVVLKVAMPARPPQGAKEESYLLTVGERAGDIEVLAIDDREWKVTVKNQGINQTLDFEHDGPKLPTGGGAGAPGAPGAVAANPAAIFGLPMNVPMPQSTGAETATTMVNSASPYQQNAGYNGGRPSGSPSEVPTESLSPNSLAATPQFQHNLTGDQQAVLIELQREQAIKAGDETAALLPITDMTEEAMGGGLQQSGRSGNSTVNLPPRGNRNSGLLPQ